MPRKTLEYAAEIYRDRDELYKVLKWDEMLEKEQEFVDLCKELAAKEAMILSLPYFLNNEEKQSLEDEDVWMIGYYIILLSKDETAFSLIKSYGFAMSKLDKEGQKYVIEKRIEAGNSVGLGGIIRDNNYTEYIDEIVKALNEKEDIRKKYTYYSMLIDLHQEEYYEEAIKAFNSEKKEFKKDSFATGLLSSVPLPDIWEYFQEETFKGDKESAETLALYGSPSDFKYIKECIKLSMDDSEALIHIGNWLSWWYGYASQDSFSVYLAMLRHDNNEVRETYYRLMMSFFEEDDPMMEGAWNLENTQSQTMLDFWQDKQDYVNETLELNVRMWRGKPFDILTVAEEIGGSNVIGHMRGIVDHLRIWTGQHFAYDDDALFVRRFEQFESIKQWIRDNKEQFPAGRWYRWGKDITEDS